MNRRYDQYLVKKYSPLYEQRHSDIRHTAMCWGFEVCNGWFSLIDQLSYALCSKWLRAKQEYEYIKDREGELQFTCFTPSEFNQTITTAMIEEAKQLMIAEEAKVPKAIQVKEKYGTLRFYVYGATDQQQNYIDFAESMSSRICELCGKPGKRNQWGWLTTACKEHRSS
jgi:hypothetical protein